MNLYTPYMSNDEILAAIHHRHPRICLNLDLMRQIPINFPNHTNLQWNQINFSRTNQSSLNESQGIYIFSVNAYDVTPAPSFLGGHIILYIGQTVNLRQRFGQYLGYRNSKKTADQQKRVMTLIWGNDLMFNYAETDYLTQEQLDDLEYDLIDSIQPPFCYKYRSELIQGYRSINRTAII